MYFVGFVVRHYIIPTLEAILNLKINKTRFLLAGV